MHQIKANFMKVIDSSIIYIGQTINTARKAWGYSSGYQTRQGNSSRDRYDVDHKIIWGYFRKETTISAAVNVTVDYVCSDGWDIEVISDEEGEGGLQKVIAERFFAVNNWNMQLRNNAGLLALFGDSLQEITLNGFQYPSEAHVLELQEFIPNETKKGKLLSWDQYQRGKKVASLAPDKVLHFSINVYGDHRMGVSNIEPALMSASTKLLGEHFTAATFKNHKPRGYWHFPLKMPTGAYNKAVDMIIEAKKDPHKDIYFKSDDVKYSSLIEPANLQLKELLEYCRDQIVTGTLVPPILLGIPGDSNKANGDIQMQGFDRRVRAIQTSMEYTTNTDLFLKLFGFDKIRFKFRRVNKRDELREIEMADKLDGKVTLNEVREKLGYPALDISEFPEADKIWHKAQIPNPVPGFGDASASLPQDQERENNEQNDDDIDKQDPDKKKRDKLKPGTQAKKAFKAIATMKAMKDAETPIVAPARITQAKRSELAPKENPIRESDERALSKVLIDWINEIVLQTQVEVKNRQFTMRKAIDDPAFIADRIMTLEIVDKLKQDVQTHIESAYTKGVDSVGKELVQVFAVDQDAKRFLADMTFDLVKGLSDSMANKLRMVLRQGMMSGQSPTDIAKQIKLSMGIEANRANTIARTEMQRAGNSGRLQAYTDGGVTHKKWLAIIDDATSGICRGLNGDVVPIDKPFQGWDRKEVVVMAPPAHPNCRSTIVAATAEESEE